MMLALCTSGCTTSEETRQPAAVPLPAIAPGTDYGLGVSALAAGEIDGTLIVAGGANFPDTPAAEGGKKRFYDEIFILTEGSDVWESSGRLPAPSAYGAVFQLDDRIIIAGGASEEGTTADVVELSVVKSDCSDEQCDGLDGTFVTVTPLPPLPIPIEQAAATRCGKKLYIAGGMTNGASSLGIYVCDLADSGEWTMTAELPEPFVQPIAAATERYLYVWGGFDPKAKCAADYGFRYDMENRVWSRIEGLPDHGTAVGSTAVQNAEGDLLVTGGVNIDIFNYALGLTPNKIKEYQSQPVDYYRFRPQIMTFDTATEKWSISAVSPAAARAGAAVVLSPQRGLVIINGELKPGIRSAEVNALEIL